MTAVERGRFGRLLARVPTRRLRRRLVRCVPHLDFSTKARPSFLYASGRANRCNPAGVDCLYLSETESTAEVELAAAWRSPG